MIARRLGRATARRDGRRDGHRLSAFDRMGRTTMFFFRLVFTPASWPEPRAPRHHRQAIAMRPVQLRPIPALRIAWGKIRALYRAKHLLVLA